MRSRSSKNAVANVLCVWACGAIFGETLGAAIVRKQSFRPENELGSFGFMIYGSKLIEIMTFRSSQKMTKMKNFLSNFEIAQMCFWRLQMLRRGVASYRKASSVHFCLFRALNEALQTSSNSAFFQI